MRVVLASSNRGKLRELAALLEPLGHELIPQDELGVTSPPETGDTFVANALIKANHAARATGLAALADDSGIEVDELNGRPGVLSARFAGEDATDEQNVVKLLEELRGVPSARRTARFQCVIVLAHRSDDPSPLIAPKGRGKGVLLRAHAAVMASATTPCSCRRASRSRRLSWTPQKRTYAVIERRPCVRLFRNCERSSDGVASSGVHGIPARRHERAFAGLRAPHALRRCVGRGHEGGPAYGVLLRRPPFRARVAG